MPRASTFRVLVLLAGLCGVPPALTFAAGESQPRQDGGLWPWASQNAPKPPPIPPYEVPTFHGKRDFRSAAAWHKAPRIDGDAVFRAVVACFPSKSTWGLDLRFQAAIRTASAVDVTGTAIGKNMVSIVASMPLYSAVEIDRERQRELQRREDAAKNVAEFINQLAIRNAALRSLALAAAMESRAQIRVNEGIADVDEQIKFLDRVIAQENALITAEAKAMAARLALVAMCRDEQADALNAYLSDLAAVPEAAKP